MLEAYSQQFYETNNIALFHYQYDSDWIRGSYNEEEEKSPM